MTWIQTHTGGAVDLLDPRPEQIHQHDIEDTLARVPRFCGHTVEPFNIAQHSMLVHNILDWLVPEAPREMRLAALLHDAHEAFMGDISTPVADVLGPAVKQLKRRLDRAIRLRFGLPEMLPDGWEGLIRTADRTALATEKEWLMGGPEPRPWAEWGTMPQPWILADLSLQGRYMLSRTFGPTLRGYVG